MHVGDLKDVACLKSEFLIDNAILTRFWLHCELFFSYLLYGDNEKA